MSSKNSTAQGVSISTPAHSLFEFSNGVKFCSQFDNGNMVSCEMGNKKDEYRIWTAPDCAGTDYERQGKPNAWFYFNVTGISEGVNLKICIVNASNHSGLYKHDMRPVFKSNSTNQRWARLKNSVRFVKGTDGEGPSLHFEHRVELPDDHLSFAFTYPYTYTMVQNDLQALEGHKNDLSDPEAIYYNRELLIKTRDGLKVDVLTVTASNGADVGDWDPTDTSNTAAVEGKCPKFAREPLFSGCFPEANQDGSTTSILKTTGKIVFDTSVTRSMQWPTKEILWVSGRVHPGEVPAQHTFKGILDFVMDPNDIIAKEMRKRFVIKLIPILNPDGVYRGHFRLDQFGQNLNRHYSTPDVINQTPIYAAKKLLDYYSEQKKLSLYLDLHAHASKRGCFIYGNVMDSIDDQVQNMLYCRLIALNTPNFDYEGCLFSREHMQRIDPGDRGANLTAEGSGRVATYLQQNIVHSYTLECNYNCSKSGNEVPPVDSPAADTGGLQRNQQSASAFTTYPDKFTPAIWGSVGRACVVAMMDIRECNPASRIPKSKAKTLNRYRSSVMGEVRQRKEYKQQRGPSGAASGPNALVDANWRPRITTEAEADSYRTNQERFTITNAPLLPSDLAYNRIKTRGAGLPGGMAGGNGDGSSSSSSIRNTTATRPGGRPQGTFQRGNSGSSSGRGGGAGKAGAPRSSTASGNAKTSASGLGLVNMQGVGANGIATNSGRAPLGVPLRSSSAAATTQAGHLDGTEAGVSTNGLGVDGRQRQGQANIKMAPLNMRDSSTLQQRDPTPIASQAQQQAMKPSASVKVAPLLGSSAKNRNPTPIATQVQQEGSPQPFFSSGGGPNHPNYSPEGREGADRGTVGAAGIRPSMDSRGSNRGVRTAMLHDHSTTVQGHMQHQNQQLLSKNELDREFGSPAMSAMSMPRLILGKDGLNSSPDRVAGKVGAYQDLNDMVHHTLGNNGNSSASIGGGAKGGGGGDFPLQSSAVRLKPKVKRGASSGQGHIEAISSASAALHGSGGNGASDGTGGNSVYGYGTAAVLTSNALSEDSAAAYNNRDAKPTPTRRATGGNIPKPSKLKPTGAGVGVGYGDKGGNISSGSSFYNKGGSSIPRPGKLSRPSQLSPVRNPKKTML